jgi:type II secretory pathway pseudopilin PulG
MARSSRTGNPQRRTGGFAYVLLIAAIALISLAASASLEYGASMTRRSAERELLAIGAEFQQALHSYAGVPDGGVASLARGPKNLADLLRDPRVPGVRRHLRQLYADPLTGKAEWGLVLDPQGHIVGVHSLATGRPIQRTGFEPRFGRLEQAESYSGWVFGLRPALPQSKPVLPQ